MNIIERLRAHYQIQPPRYSFKGSSEGLTMEAQLFDKRPNQKAIDLEIPVWREFKQANAGVSLDGYCVVNVLLDASENGNPEMLPLPPQMEGHELETEIYVDCLNCIRMRAIGGYTRCKE